MKAVKHRAILVLVAYHPKEAEVERIHACLELLPADIGYAIVSNDHRPGEFVERLAEGAVLFLANISNPGYGKAINQAVRQLEADGFHSPYLGALNTDLVWEEGCFEAMLDWMDTQEQIVVAVPRILNPAGEVQYLCKNDPTVLAFLSRRFFPAKFKPKWLRRYDSWYIMESENYDVMFDVPYLSGCCMLMRSRAFQAVGGFDERFFLYLEDADLTRALRRIGRTVHLPAASVIHHWGRGNHHSKWLTLVNIQSAWIYFRKWGWRFV
jgi:GT2 family glycosyltransferase